MARKVEKPGPVEAALRAMLASARKSGMQISEITFDNAVVESLMSEFLIRERYLPRRGRWCVEFDGVILKTKELI